MAVVATPGPDTWARTRVAEESLASAEPLGTVEWLQVLCRAAARTLSASGVAVSVTTDDGERAMAAASDGAAADVEELQFTLGEGPCRDAFSSSRPVLVADLSERSVIGRWPGYATDVREHGVCAVFAFPMHAGVARLGTLSVYYGEPLVLSTEELARTLAFVDLATTTLLDGQTEIAEGLDAELGHELTSYRGQVYQAQGMAMVQLGVGPSEALARLRAHAYANGRRLADVASDVVERRIHVDEGET